jgi:SAM-dependent MidA family methyltransferase
MSIKESILGKIHADGPLCFHDFMEMALYHPEGGYYTSPGERIGSKGDYFTSPCLGNIFGAMIGKQVEEMWRILKEPAFTIVEYGAGNGALCYDVLTYLQKNTSLYNNLTYYIIEKSPEMIKKEKIILNDLLHKIKWIGSIKEAGDITGCILSNELVDNFSVHRIVMQDELMEVFVDYKEHFIEVARPAAPELKDYLHRFNVMLPKGFKTEINLQAEDWMSEVATTLKKGFVITIDYGYPSNELYNYKRAAGTMLCYHNHTINDDPFLHVGEQDITTHVNFSALLHAGKKEGLNCCGFTSQSYFLSSLGLADHIRCIEQHDGNKSNQHNGIAAITSLIRMGQKFNVLIQQKGLEEVFLSGMKLAYPLH